MDHAFCLDVQRPYLGRVEAHYTDWTPDRHPLAAVRRGDRRERPLAIPERAGHLSRFSGLRRGPRPGFDRAGDKAENRMRLVGIVLMMALAGCATERVAGGGQGLPQVAMRNNSSEVVPPGRASLGLAVRTFVPADDGWSEVTGARCRVTGGHYFAAELVTPARLIVQDLGPDAPPLQAECASGTLRGADAVAPAFGWPEEGRPSAVHRFWWGGGWWWGYQRTGPMRYPDLAVALHPATAH